MEYIQIIEIIAATIGILYVWLELRASMWLWPVGIILPLFYIYISWESAVYGNVLVNIYYILACIYGWARWYRHRQEEREEEMIQHTSPRSGALALMITLLLHCSFWYLFWHYMDSPFPFWDALATAVSFVGMWFLAKKEIETWYCWILSNVIYCLLYFYQGFIVTGLFFTIYTVIAVMGYFNWKKLMRQQQIR